MKKVVAFFLFFVLFILFPLKTHAIQDPLSVPNNKFGVHILFPEEITNAATLVNSSEGQWGYVTIPIQAGDKDLEKWQKFMDDARALHIIPLIRLATDGDYFNTKVWRKPSVEDIIDFANFLDSLSWPIKNRYIIVFNEVNRGDEWGGVPNADEYARLLSYTVDVFKSKSPDFFIISSGLDNASVTILGTSVDKFFYMKEMEGSSPGIFSKIDGLASHSYPNPAFSQPPTKQDTISIASFKFERDLAKQLGGKDLPIFITETGWSAERIPQETIAQYYKTTFSSVWNDTTVVAITPFLLRANHGSFVQFSLLTLDNTPTLQYKSIFNLPKVKGEPKLASPSSVLGEKSTTKSNLPTRNFSTVRNNDIPYVFLAEPVKIIAKWLLKL